MFAAVGGGEGEAPPGGSFLVDYTVVVIEDFVDADLDGEGVAGRSDACGGVVVFSVVMAWEGGEMVRWDFLNKGAWRGGRAGWHWALTDNEGILG